MVTGKKTTADTLSDHSMQAFPPARKDHVSLSLYHGDKQGDKSNKKTVSRVRSSDDVFINVSVKA